MTARTARSRSGTTRVRLRACRATGTCSSGSATRSSPRPATRTACSRPAIRRPGTCRATAVADGALERSAAASTWCEWKGAATYWDVLGLTAAAWSYETPSPGYEAITGYVTFYPARLACSIDGEPVRPQEGGFYGGWITSDVVGPFKGGPGTWAGEGGLAVVLLAARCARRPAQAQAAARDCHRPTAAVFDYQIGGAYPPDAAVRIVDRDRTDSAGARALQHLLRQRVPDPARRASLVDAPSPESVAAQRDRRLPAAIPNWPGEYVLNTSTAARAARDRAHRGRLDRRLRAQGLRRGRAGQPRFVDAQGRESPAHPCRTTSTWRRCWRGVRTATVSRSRRRTPSRRRVPVSDQVHFDFAIAEECQVYHECGGYRTLLRLARVRGRVLARSAFRAACARHGGKHVDHPARSRRDAARQSGTTCYDHC